MKTASTGLRVFYGGTFDPVHFGHLAIADAAHRALDVPIRLMPAADPPHRDAPGAHAEDRAAMLDLAVREQPGLRVDRRELRREGRSYTIDTVHELRAQYGADAPLALLIGADSLLGLHTWKGWRELITAAHFVIAERPGSAIDGHAIDERMPAELAQALDGRWATTGGALHDAPGGRLLRLRQPLHAGSATEIRRRIAERQPWEHLLPQSVAEYIRAHGLYGAGLGGAGPNHAPI